MNGSRKSDSFVVPEKCPNKDCGAPQPAEGVEGRRLTKGNSGQQTKRRTQSRESLQHALDRIRQAARRDKQLRFTTLWHHVYDLERLEKAYRGLNRKALPESTKSRGRSTAATSRRTSKSFPDD